ncbi:g10165 [Coccomyxa viridis]|uniref:G10165 protein n=1 Tax=Coccomyxa viridis TaxID=1274662 RepID=A0ABP1G4T0_9CHLO
MAGPLDEPAKLGQRTSAEQADTNGHDTEQSSRPPSVFSVSQDDEEMEKRVTRKLHWHIMSRFVMLTVLNHMDRANLAYASVQLNADLGLSDYVYGVGSGIFFLGYMVFQIPSQLVAERVGLPYWIGFLMVGWGITATLMAGLTSSPTHLYLLRFLLGMFEAGTFPAMWAHLTRFYAGGPHLAAAWGFIGAAQPFAQVISGPIASGILLADGAGGLKGWQWLFLIEGLPTILLGVWIFFTLSPTAVGAKFLTPAEQEYVHTHVKEHKERMAKDSGIQSTWYGITCWKVYAQGLASGWAGIMRYGAMFWTPLIVFFIMKGRSSSEGASSEELKHAGAAAAALAGIPYGWSAIVTYLNAWHAKRTGEMYFHLITPLAVGAVALAMLTVSLGRNEYAAFVGLMLAATSQASNPLEWGYPATYLHGPALTSGWAVANCISAYGGIVGPYMIGALKAKFQGYTVPMLVMTCVNSLAVVYFAILLPFLPAKSSKAEAAGGAAAEEGQAPGPTGASAMASPPSRCPSDALLSREDSGKEVKPHKGAE